VIGPQLPLSVQLPDAPGFDSYFAGPNGDTVAALGQLAEGAAQASILLHGAAGSGKTHLLQAVARAATRARRRTAYLPLRSLAPAALQGFETMDVLSLDDIDAVLQDRSWSLVLLRLIDAVHARGGRCVLSALAPPEGLPLAPLPDLRTRLAACAVFGLKPLTDRDLGGLLQLRAHQRGLELPPESAELLLSRLRRDVPSLIAALDWLDRASLSAGRRLNPPFVRSVLPALVQ
jgi:DnaA family protein